MLHQHYLIISITPSLFKGYYADPEAECQAFHICTADGAGGLATYSFLCPNGTLFNQNYFICDWWFNFDCATAQDLYSLNDEIAAQRDALAGASDQAQYGAPAEYGAASSLLSKQGLKSSNMTETQSNFVECDMAQCCSNVTATVGGIFPALGPD